MTTPPIEAHDICVSYERRPVLWGLDFAIPAGKTIAIVGPNGAGKSTLIKVIMGLVPLASGWVKIFGEPVRSRRSLIAYVPQREQIDWDFPVSAFDVVLMGRYGALPFWGRPKKADREIALHSLSRVGMSDFADRHISQLSGGQQQRVFIARALAQEANIYLMDEPFSGVDAATEKTILDLFSELTANGKTLICVHHDLHTVQEFFDWTLLLNLRQVAFGPTSEVFTAENLSKTYGGRLGILTEMTEKVRAAGALSDKV